MDLEKVYIVDIETTGLLHEMEGVETDLHVLGVSYNVSGEWKIKTTNKRKDIEKLLGNPNNVIVGHNFYLFDIPALEKIYKGIEIKAYIIDTLFLAWYIEPNRLKEGGRYGLEDYGEQFGVPKPEITSWTDLSYEEYSNRVSQDVRINTNLWFYLLQKLRELYEGDNKKIVSLIKFLMTKAQQYKMHQDFPLRIDIEQAEKNLKILEGMLEERISALQEVMPKVQVKVTRKKPKNCYKKDGSYSVAGAKWFKMVEACGLPIDYDGEIEEVVRLEEPNPKSVAQVKQWLFSLGWKPEIFTETILKSGKENKVPQLRDKNKNLCKSVLKLKEQYPQIQHLEDLGVLQHRIGIIKGFLRDSDAEGNIVAGIAGLTNTLRIRHKYLVNLPSVSSLYGEYIRSLIKPQEGQEIVGSDLSSLENVTRNNFIFPLDPEYVQQMDDEYYDSHLDIGQVAGLISTEESLFYKWYKEQKKNPNMKPEDIQTPTEDYKYIQESYVTQEQQEKFFEKIDKKRQVCKQLNYSCLYGIGKAKLSKDLDTTQKEAKGLIDAYWKRNWSVKKFASMCKVVTIDKQMWVQNPLNGYYYSLRSEKDIFSTVNQSAGDYIFTLWVYFLMKQGVKVQAGFHDELVVSTLRSNRDEIIQKLQQSIQKVNDYLGLQIPVGIDYKIGDSYADVH